MSLSRDKNLLLKGVTLIDAIIHNYDCSWSAVLRMQSKRTQKHGKSPQWAGLPWGQRLKIYTFVTTEYMSDSLPPHRPDLLIKRIHHTRVMHTSDALPVSGLKVAKASDNIPLDSKLDLQTVLDTFLDGDGFVFQLRKVSCLCICVCV